MPATERGARTESESARERTVAAASSTASAAIDVASAGDLLSRLRRLVSDRLPGIVGVGAGYSQWDDEDPLEHDTRRRLDERVDTEAGSYLTALAEADEAEAAEAAERTDEAIGD